MDESQNTFLAAYPFLEIVQLSGDGHSCQFEAVGFAACGTESVSRNLREMAVDSIRNKWAAIGDVVLAEISHQSNIEVGDLDQARCCELLLGSANRSPLWGNHLTIAQLPAIVNKRIVLLTLSNEKPFKHVFECDGTEDTIHIGLLPEAHYFPVRPKASTKLQKGDKGKLCYPLFSIF